MTPAIAHVQHKLLNFFRLNPDAARIIAVVGSSSPVNDEMVNEYSDIDIILLTEHSHGIDFAGLLQGRVGSTWVVINTWDIVSPVAIGSPTIHLHQSEVVSYSAFSHLFRRAVAKYPSLLGPSLALFAPSGRISTTELLGDALGLNALHAKLSAVAERNENAVSHSGVFAELIDVSLYCVLHSIRNTLRWRGGFQELSPASSLPRFWQKAQGPGLDTVLEFVAQKQRRRAGAYFHPAEELESARRGCEFLRELCLWVGSGVGGENPDLRDN